jgi:toxin ParE1/3/4
MGRFLKSIFVDADLLEISGYISQDNPSAANDVIDATFSTFEMLADSPGMGRLRIFMDGRLKKIRSFPVSGFSNYLIFYREAANGIEIVRVVHGARDLEKFFEEN